MTIEYKGEVRHYTAAIFKYGYTHRILVKIDDFEVNLEPDEEGHLRAIIDEHNKEILQLVDVQLVQAIVDELEAALS